jgi:hypothetical protein
MLAIFFMLVVLKIPVIFMIWLVFWASQRADSIDPQDDEGRGGPGCGGRPSPSPIDCGPRLRIANKKASQNRAKKALKTLR